MTRWEELRPRERAMVLQQAREGIAILGLLALALGALALFAAAQTPPPANGDWVVEDDVSITGETIVVRGGLTVSPTGKLTLIDVDLTLTCSTYEPWILVQGSGELVIKDRDGDPASTSDASHVINSATDQGTLLTYSEGSRGLVSCSFLTRVSILALNEMLIVSGCTIEGARNRSIDGEGCDLIVMRTNILRSATHAVYVAGGSLQMDWCYINGSSNTGVNLTSGTVARVSNCSLDSTVVGAHATASTALFEDCAFTATSYTAIGLFDITGCVLKRCSVSEQMHRKLPEIGSCYGLRAVGVDRLLVSECEFKDLDCLTVSVTGAAILDQCTFIHCWTGLSLGTGSIAVRGCTFYENHVGIEVMNQGSGVQTIEDCDVNESTATGVWVEGERGVYANVTLVNCRLSGNYLTGVTAINALLLMDHCTVGDSLIGIQVQSLTGGVISTAVLGNCSISGSNEGIKVQDSILVMEDCIVADNFIGCDMVNATWGALRRCSFSNQSSAGCDLVAACVGKLVVTGCAFRNGPGVALSNHVELKDCVFDACMRGIIIDSGLITIAGCRFSSNGVGASFVATGGRVAVLEGCTFVRNKEDGVVVGAPGGGIVEAILRECTFERNGYNGVRVDDGGRCVLVDPRLSDNGAHGIKCAEGGIVEWRVETYSSATNDSSVLRGNVTVSPSGTLELTNATLTFLYNASFASGIRVEGGALVLSDLDGDPSTGLDGCLIRGEEGLGYLYHPTTYVSVTDGGRLEGRCARFQEAPITVEGARCELRDCELSGWGGVALTLGNTSGPSILHGCLVRWFNVGVHAWNSPFDIDDCVFRTCVIGIESVHCGDVSVQASSFSGCCKGLDVMGSSRLVLKEVLIVDGEAGVIAFDVDDLRLIGSTISGCSLDGVTLTLCNATIASCTMRDIGGSGVVAVASTVGIDGLHIGGCGGQGLRANWSTVQAVSLMVNETDGSAAWLEGGDAEISHSSLDSRGAIALLAEEDAAVRCYNTTVEGLRAVARDSALVELFNQVRVSVTLMDGRDPPATLWIAIESATGIEALNAPLGPSASTGWIWLKQVAISPDGLEWHSPYAAMVSYSDRSVMETFEVDRRMDVMIELPHQVEASIAFEEEVYEGVETTLDGTASSTWPFELATFEWDIGYDGVFAPDGWGGRLWWTFDANGTRKVALRVTDAAGGRAIAVVEVAVRDLGPAAAIIPPPPGEVAEDEKVELDGRITSAADAVEFISWDLGDGRVVEGAHPIVSWPRAGSYVVTLTAVDMDGSRATARAVMTVVNQPPVAVVPVARLEVGKGVPFVLDASRSSDTPSDMPSLRYEWEVEGIGIFEGQRPTVTIGTVSGFHVTLRVTDSDGASSTAAMTVVVVNSPPIVGRLDDISMRRTDKPQEIALGGKVTDPDDDARNVTVRATSGRPDLVGVDVRRLDDGTYLLTVTPVGTGGAVGRAVVTVTATDRDGGTAEGAFNVTLLKAPETQPQATPAWVMPSLGLSLVLVLVAVVLLLRWARTRRGGPPDGAS